MLVDARLTFHQSGWDARMLASTEMILIAKPWQVCASHSNKGFDRGPLDPSRRGVGSAQDPFIPASVVVHSSHAPAEHYLPYEDIGGLTKPLQ